MGGGIWVWVRDHYVVAMKGTRPLIHTAERNGPYWVTVVCSEWSTVCFGPHLCHCGPRSGGHWNALPGSSSHLRRSAAQQSSSHRCPPLLWPRSHRVCLPEQPPVGAREVKGRNSGTYNNMFAPSFSDLKWVKCWLYLCLLEKCSLPQLMVEENWEKSLKKSIKMFYQFKSQKLRDNKPEVP